LVGGWSRPHPGRFTPGKETWYPLYKRLGWPQDRSGRVRKISPPSEIRSPDHPACNASLYRLRSLGREYSVLVTTVLRIHRFSVPSSELLFQSVPDSSFTSAVFSCVTSLSIILNIRCNNATTQEIH